jgi:hypothetical protein
MSDNILDSEVGRLLVAEEFDLLARRSVLRIALALCIGGPMTLRQINKAGLGPAASINKYLKFLVEHGRVIRMRRVEPKQRNKPQKTMYYYYWADEHTPCALEEILLFLERRHRDEAESIALMHSTLMRSVPKV